MLFLTQGSLVAPRAGRKAGAAAARAPSVSVVRPSARPSAVSPAGTRRSARLLERVRLSALEKAFVLLASAALALPAAAVPTPEGTNIDNTATVAYDFGGASITATSNLVRSTTVGRTNSTLPTIDFYQYVPPSPSPASARKAALESYPAAPTSCETGGSFQLQPDPPDAGGNPIDVDQPVPLSLTNVLHQGDPLFVKITDGDHNTNRTARDTVRITLQVAGTGDSERMQFTETGPDTGDFVGFVRTNAPPAVVGDCFLAVRGGETITAIYEDFESFTANAELLVDPLGVVFDASTNAPVSGAQVTLVDAATGLPAAVFGDDGVSTFPATLTSGGSATDGGGTVYTFGPGEYRFPFVRPGNYRLSVTPPAGFLFPSTVPDALMPAGREIVVGSRGEVFNVPAGPALFVDLPVDAATGDLFLQKSASVDAAAIGDFVEWRITLSNGSAIGSATAVQLVDQMSAGLRYRPGSARRDGAPIANPTVSDDGRTLSFAVGTVAPAASVVLTYVTEVAPNARGNALRNSAQATAAGGVSSNTAQAAVELREDLFGERATLVGEVLEGCGVDAKDGVAGVRVMLEDGTYAISDEKGRYHFRGVSPGSHVVQLDAATLPEGYEVELCDANTRFAGRAYSQFVDLQRGALWRADFRVKRGAPATGLVRTQLRGAALAQEQGVALYEFDLASRGGVPLSNLRASFVLPDGATLVAGSAVLDGAAIVDARAEDGVLTLRLGDRDGPFVHKIAFRLQLGRLDGEHALRAVLTLDTPTKKNVRPSPVEVTLAPVAERFDLRSSRVLFTPHFETRRWSLTQDDKAELRRLTKGAEDLSNLRLHVVGFTDARDVGPSAADDLADNDDLSRRRAAAVADYLAAELGVARERISVEGRGEDEPVGDNDDWQGQQLNRRVAIAVVGVEHTAGKGSAAESPVAELEVIGLRPDQAAGLPKAGSAVAQVAAGAEWQKNYAPYARAVDGAFLASLQPGHALLWPAAEVNPAVPSVKVAVQHRKGETVELTLNGQPVPNTHVSGVDAAADRDVEVRQWAGVDIIEGPNTLVATVRDASGLPVATIERVVHYSGQAVRAEFVADGSLLVADGKTRPIVAVRLFDRWGKPVRPGASGEFDIGAPFEVWRDLDDRNMDKLFVVGDVRSSWTAGADGIAHIELKPTSDSGQVQLRFRFSQKLTQDVFAWLEPADRDWVLVGLAEGTLGHNTVKNNAAAFEAAGGAPDYYEDGRIAFYAKGMVKGDTLLTIAYDTSKDRQTGGAELEQQIDPNSYYLLYGDDTEQGADAASIRNLYLRVDRKQFYAMFGDFDTGLTVTELGRYSRRVNGLKSEYHGETLQYSAFASEDTTAFRKDELPGDGTSGLYRLSRHPIVLNSEQVRIEVRDRFHSEQIISQSTLARFTDYTIDYTAGTLFFRRPVPSRDEGFNPIFIVVDYETQSSGEGTFSGGGRGAIALAGGKVEVGATAIHEGTTGADGNLVAADLKVKLGEATELRAEVGASDTGTGATQQDGTAYTIKVEHLGEVVAGRVYAREQDAAYGIGQQSGGEAGTRKIGAEGTIKVNEDLDVRAQAYLQDNLTSGGQRQVVEAEVHYRTEDNTYSATGGVRHAAETGLAAGDLVSDQVYAGGTAQVMEDVTLRAQAELSVSGASAATAYPERFTVGADYKMTDSATAFLEHEVAQGAAQDSDMTRIGVRTTPWERGRADASLESRYSEYGPRLFATVGLGQGWQATDDLLFDFGVDRVHTIRSPGDPDFDLDVPPASGSDPNGDFTAWYAGATYRRSDWTMNGRLETFRGDLEDRWGVSAGAYRAQGEQLGVSLKLRFLEGERMTGDRSTDAEFSIGLAWRPTNPEFIWLDRVDLVYDEAYAPASGWARSYKLINNLNLNHRPNARWQTSYQYAFKWVRAQFDESYGGFSDLLGLDSRYDLTPEWDVGVQVFARHAWETGAVDHSAGIALGHAFAENVWLSVGYNIAGFDDPDFAGARYTAQGPYVQLRLKFDQDSFKDLKSLMAKPATAAPETSR
jgi:uncharacterized repeat protein (TIGR01451 family)